MPAFPYGLPYQTRLVPGAEVLVSHWWSPWSQIQGGSVHFSTVLSDLGARLAPPRLAIAKKFVRAASQSARRPCTVLLVQKGTSVHLEVFSTDLFFWETWCARAITMALAYHCGSYPVDGGRVMWVQFGW